MELAVMCITGAATIAALHWMPWGKLFGKRLHRVVAYSVGVGVIGATFTAWAAWARPTWDWAIIGFWITTASVGLGDVLAYALDGLGGLLMKERTFGRTSEDGAERN